MSIINRKRGLGLIEIAIGIGLVGLISVAMMRTIEEQNQGQKAVNSALLIGNIQVASQDYLRTYNQQLLSATPVGGSAIAIPVGRSDASSAPPPGPNSNLPSIQASGLLPPNFIDRDAFRYGHMLLVRQPVAGILEGLVIQASTPGALPIRDGELGRIVFRIGPNGGSIPSVRLNGATATRVQGNAGSWASDSALWASSGFQPLPGRAVATVSFGNAGLLSDYLNRYDIGVPEANTMRAGLNMGNNNITAAKDINAATLATTGAIQAGSGGAYGPAEFPGLSMYMQNGGIACAGNADGCKFWISDDGGFADKNDGWITFQGQSANKGLSIDGVGNNLLVGGNTNTNGNLWVGMDSYTAGNAQIVKDLEVKGNIKGGGTLDMDGDSRFGGSLFVRGPTTLNGGLTVNGTTEINSDAYVRGNGSIDGDAQIGGNLYTAKTAIVGGELGVAGNIVGGNIVSSSDIGAVGSVNANKTVFANEQLATNGRIIAVGDIGSTQGNIEVANGGLHASKDINTNGNMTAVGISAAGPLYGNTVDGNYIRQGGILLDDRIMQFIRYCKANPTDPNCG